MSKDENIHQSLERIDVPPPRSDFFDTLQQRLDTEPVPESGDGGITDVAHRRSRKWRRVAASSSISVAAAVVVVALVINTTNGPVRPGPPGSPVALPPTTETTPPTTEVKTLLASQVFARMNTTIASINSLQANVQVVQHPYSISVDQKIDLPGFTLNGEMRLRSDGSTYFDYSNGPGESHGPQIDSYNASTGVQVSCFNSGSWSCNTTEGITDLDLAARGQLQLDTFSSVVRKLVADDSEKVEEVTYAGRAAWKFQAKYPLTDATYIDAATVYVDQQTEFPIRIEATSRGRAYSETTVSNLQINPTFTDADFVLTPKKGWQINPVDKRAFQRVTPAVAQTRAGYRSVSPSALPDGFTPAEVSFAKDAGPGGPEGLNPVNRDVIVTTYRKGIQSFTVSTRRSSGQNWLDPLAPEYDTVISRSNTKLSGGFFVGSTAESKTTVDEQRLWVKNNTLVLTISGDLTADQMVSLANAMEAGK